MVVFPSAPAPIVSTAPASVSVYDPGASRYSFASAPLFVVFS